MKTRKGPICLNLPIEDCYFEITISTAVGTGGKSLTQRAPTCICTCILSVRCQSVRGLNMPRYWGNCHTRLFCLHSAPCPPHIICGPESSVWLTILSECIIVRHSPGQDVCDCICWGDNSSGGSCFLHTHPLGDAALPHPTMKVVFSWHSLLGRYILWWQLHTEALRDKVLGQKKKKHWKGFFICLAAKRKRHLITHMTENSVFTTKQDIIDWNGICIGAHWDWIWGLPQWNNEDEWGLYLAFASWMRVGNLSAR